MGPDGKARRCDTARARIGLTVGKVLGKAVERNRIKRRMRECMRRHASTLTYPVDVILHPRRTVLEMEFAKLDREVAQIFRIIQAALSKGRTALSSGQRKGSSESVRDAALKAVFWIYKRMISPVAAYLRSLAVHLPADVFRVRLRRDSPARRATRGSDGNIAHRTLSSDV